MALTKRDVDRLRWDPAGQRIQLHPDGDVPGLFLRVFPSGHKSFVLRYRATGAQQPRMLTLGKYGVITLHQARKLARTELLKVKTGTDPQAERQRSRSGETMRDLATVYLERHAKKQKKSWPEDERRIERRILPALGRRRIADVKRSDIARLHNRIGDSAPYEANRVLALLGAMFGKAVEWGLLEEDAPNPAAHVQPFAEKSRDRWVRPDELPALWEAIDTEADVYVATALKLYLLTGMRKNELLRLRWPDIDLGRRAIRLRDTKAGRPHVVHLSEPAVQLLEVLPRQRVAGHVFPGRVEGKPLVNIAKSWRRVRARFWLLTNPESAAALRRQAAAEVKRRPKHASKGEQAVEARLVALASKHAGGEDGLRLHDLRRTVGAMMATSGTSVAVVGKVLNHTTPSATAVYARIADVAAANALEEHGARVAQLTRRDGA